ncbi:dihydrofolate reductase [Flavobacterium branchiophilum]|uniref:Dihydrofolate reductase n=1 Tax=Flavobacterium branchiophilum TaxID=55197 RepID=A0A2H3KB75_9FLAO|nr:dihydrofolate reductase [Flavobacterium branchiophilum]PDS24219.1 diacylglycerol kinase [Flavobacterium branchiophilum]
MIIIIAAMAQNRALGKNNTLLWHLPNDFKRFKTQTTGHYIVMGRKTFESFPKPLPNRTHVIVSKTKNFDSEHCITVQNLEEALAICPKNQDLYIIGGGEIYKQTMPMADVLDITLVEATFEADTFFPEINPKEWQLASKESHPIDDKHPYEYHFLTYIRK